MVNIVIADNNFIVRAGLRSVLSQCEDYQIVAEVTTNTELTEILQTFDVKASGLAPIS